MSTISGMIARALVLVSFLAAATATAHASDWHYVTCGHIQWNGLSNEYTSGAKGEPVPCRRARRVLKTYLRTHHRNVGQWRCNGGGQNGAVLGQCRRPGRFIAVYDARWGE